MNRTCKLYFVKMENVRPFIIREFLLTIGIRFDERLIFSEKNVEVNRCRYSSLNSTSQAFTYKEIVRRTTHNEQELIKMYNHIFIDSLEIIFGDRISSRLTMIYHKTSKDLMKAKKGLERVYSDIE